VAKNPFGVRTGRAGDDRGAIHLVTGPKKKKKTPGDDLTELVRRGRKKKNKKTNREQRKKNRPEASNQGKRKGTQETGIFQGFKMDKKKKNLERGKTPHYRGHTGRERFVRKSLWGGPRGGENVGKTCR